MEFDKAIISQNKQRPSFARTDSIRLSQQDYHQLFEWKENNREAVRNFNPVLSEGVIIIEKNIYQYFKQDGQHVLFELYFGDVIFLDIIAELLDNHSYRLLHEYVNDELLQKLPNYNVQKAVEDAITLHASLMAYMEYHSENKEYVDTEIVRQNTAGRKKRKDKTRANIVKIKQRIYRVHIGQNTEEVKEKRKIVRKAEKWTVRGHWRHLKNGRKVWIRPHSRGSGEQTSKIYHF